MERDTIDLALVKVNMQGIKVTKSDINVSKCGAFDIDNMRGMTLIRQTIISKDTILVDHNAW